MVQVSRNAALNLNLRLAIEESQQNATQVVGRETLRKTSCSLVLSFGQMMLLNQ